MLYHTVWCTPTAVAEVVVKTLQTEMLLFSSFTLAPDSSWTLLLFLGIACCVSLCHTLQVRVVTALVKWLS